MRNLIIAGITLFAAWAFAQTCIIPAPTAPPRATSLTIYRPLVDGGSITLADGGTFACVGVASTQNGVAPQQYGTTPAKCNTVFAMGDQMAAIDNGWNDGGAP